MDIHFEEPHPLVLVIHPHFDRLDALQADDFRAAAHERIGGKILVILDLAEVLVVDSTGLSVIVGLLKAMPRGGHLRLARVSRSVRSLLGLTRLDRIFRCYDSVGSAMIASESSAWPERPMSRARAR